MHEILSLPTKLTSANLDLIELGFDQKVHLPFGSIDSRPSAWLRIDGEVSGRKAEGAAEGTSLPIQIPLYDDFSGNLKKNILNIVNTIESSGTQPLDSHINTISQLDLGGNFATARMTVEAALLDMVARSNDQSLVSLLTGEQRESYCIPYGKSITESSLEDALVASDEALKNGAQRLKFKLSPNNFDAIYSALKNLRETHPHVDCMVDANGMFDPENTEHIRMLQQVDSLGLLTIEEPVSRAGRIKGMMAHRALKHVLPLRTPVTIDDAVKTADDAKIALSQNLAQIVNLKPGRVGSFVECLNIADFAKKLDKEVMVGGMFEATPGRMMTLSLAAYCLKHQFRIPGDVSLPQERLSEDLVESNLYLNHNHDVVFEPKLGWGYKI